MQPNSSNFFYRVRKGADGADSLERVAFGEFNEHLITELNKTVRDYVDTENSGVMQRIAAGTALKHIFATKSYRDLGMTKHGYCRALLDRDPSTVNGYVDAAIAYEDIGGVDASVQPNSICQLDLLADVKRDFRRVVWFGAAEGTSGKPPPADAIYLVAQKAKAWIEKKKKETVAAYEPELPCSTLGEAISFAAHCQKLRRTTPEHWAKMGRFLAGLSQKEAPKVQNLQIAKSRSRKPKTIPEAKGQMQMFNEVMVPKAQ
jgi:hypothetical protein